MSIKRQSKSLRDEHAWATRKAILDAARRLFATRDYDATSVDEIAAAARVTSGALYHHFRGKRDIMKAVFEEIERELSERVVAESRPARSAREAFQLSLSAFFDACLEEDIRSIVFEQSPRVLGSEEWRRIDARYGTGLILRMLSRLRAEGHLGKYDDQLLAALFLAVIAEAGLQIARDRRSPKLRGECERILLGFLNGLREKAPHSSQQRTSG